jgi:peroxiredoxin
VQVGQGAPEFTAHATDWSLVRGVADTKGKVRIIASVPSLDTEVCDRETRRFNQEAAALDKNIVIQILSTDMPYAQKRWCGAAGVDQVMTLSDHQNAEFGEKYGVLIKERRILRGLAVAILVPDDIMKVAIPDDLLIKDLILVRETFSAGEAEENAKSDTSLRDIPMLPMVKEALQQQWASRHPDSEYVFVTRDGNPIDAHNFANRIWYSLLRYLELAKRRPYQTRHTTATLMLASGENPEWIAKLMGHTNTQMLFTVYSRFVPNLTRQDGLAIAGMLSRRPAATAASTPPAAPPEAELLAALKSLEPAALKSLLRKAKSAH